MIANHDPEAAGTWVFADEYGNTNVATEQEGVSQFFIVAAVVVRSGDLAALRAGVEQVRAEFFQTGEMKSRNLGRDRGRWARVLAAINELPFRFYALAVDKRRLDRAGGLKWKQSFYKNLCGGCGSHPDRLFARFLRLARSTTFVITVTST